MATKAQKAEKQQLKSAQKAEIKALKYSGASKSGIKAEKQANKTEFKSLLSAQKSGTYTTPSSLVGLRSEASTWGNSAYAPQVQNLLDSAAQNYIDYNIPTVSKSGKVTTGVGLDKLVDYEAGRTGDGFNKLMNNAQQYVGKTFNLVDLANQGVKLKEVKGSPGVFKDGSGGNLTLFSQNPDGTYTGTGINQIRKEDGGVFDSTLGKIALGIGGFYLGPLAGNLIGLSGGLGGAVGGGLLGGAASALGGSDWRTGLLAGGLGGFSGGGGFGSMFGTQPPAPITDAAGLPVGGGEALGASDVFTSQIQGGFGNVSDSLMAATDATRMAAQGLSNSAIQQNLIMAGVDPVIAASAADQAIMGATQSAIQSSLSGFGSLYPGVTTGALTGISTVGNIAKPTAFGGAGIDGAAPIYDRSVPFDPKAYAQTQGLGYTLGSLADLGLTGAATLWKLGKGVFGSGGGGRFGLPGGRVSLSDLAGLLGDGEEQMMGGGGFAGANADYSALLAALSAPRIQPRSLV